MEQRKEQIKVGSKVTIDSRWNGVTIRTVTGETPKYWKIRINEHYEAMYNKDTLRSKGDRSDSIRLATSADFETIERRRLAHEIEKTNFDSLPLATLRKIKELLAKGE